MWKRAARNCHLNPAEITVETYVRDVGWYLSMGLYNKLLDHCGLDVTLGEVCRLSDAELLAIRNIDSGFDKPEDAIAVLDEFLASIGLSRTRA